jgi:hypothetical protein
VGDPRRNPAARLIRLSLVVLVAAGLSPARADTADPPERGADPPERGADPPAGHPCLGELERLGVAHEPAQRRGIDVGVLVLGDIGGVSYRGYQKKPLVLDCSLVVSLAHMGPFMTAHGIERVTYSSAYQRRKVRGSDRWSKHSYGLAIDIHSLSGEELGTLQVKDDYEQGLGDDMDCLGEPLTQGGAILRALHCQILHAELFDSVLSPDYDAGHYNHFHLEARPWNERASLPLVADRPR